MAPTGFNETTAFGTDKLHQVIRDIQDTQNNCGATLTQSLNQLLQLLEISSNGSVSSEDNVKGRASSEDTFAVLYIVFVLLFFATSLVVVLVRYLLRQRESHRLESFYDNYLQNKPPRTVLFDKKGRRLTEPQVWREKSQDEELHQNQSKDPKPSKSSKVKGNNISLSRNPPRIVVNKIAHGISLSSVGNKRLSALKRHQRTSHIKI